MEPEVQGYLTSFNMKRRQIRDAIKGLDDEAANWHPLSKDTNSIYAILSHLTGAQSIWIKQIIAGIPVQRDREAELRSSGRLEDAVQHWEAMDQEVDAILEKLTASQLRETRKAQLSGDVTVQGCILFQITHYAEHLGHIQLTRQAWEQRNVK
jgi:uncharacterized damage-inducible protein DinB